jgi:hypothetical protein
MLLKITLFLVSLFSILQIWYRSTLPAMFAKSILRVGDYESFSKESKVLLLWAGLFLFLSCFFHSSQKLDKTATSSSYNWIGSFALVLGICAGLVLTINPEGRFPWMQRNTYTTIAAHSIKTNLYEKLDKTPDVIIFGSSISFTTSASHFKKWGVNAFNMSFNSGGPADFLRSLNYMIRNSPDGKTPSTILVEILSPGIRIGNPMQTPLKMLPYLPLEQTSDAVGATFDDLVLGSSLSNAIFTRSFLDTHRWEPWILFSSDGTATLGNKNNKTLTEYQTSVENDIPLGKDLLSCKNKQLNPLGREYIEKLIDLSITYHFSIVFYRPPINQDLYVLSKTKPGNYRYCKSLFNTYMQTLVGKHENIFYRDLSADPKISKMGLNVYLDTHHLNRRGNLLVLDALGKEITSALAWGRDNHK